MPAIRFVAPPTWTQVDARKLLIAFWRLVTVGEVPADVVLRPEG
jgi:hypothetical protein